MPGHLLRGLLIWHDIYHLPFVILAIICPYNRRQVGMSVHTTHVKLMWCGTNWNYLIFSPFLFSIVCIFLWLNFSSSYHKWQVMFWKWCSAKTAITSQHILFRKKRPLLKIFVGIDGIWCVSVCASHFMTDSVTLVVIY